MDGRREEIQTMTNSNNRNLKLYCISLIWLCHVLILLIIHYFCILFQTKRQNMHI